MHIKKTFLIILFYSFFATKILCAPKPNPDNPVFAFSFNALETTAFVLSNALFVNKKEPKLGFWPFHFDAHTKINNKIGLSFGLVYRFEDYQDEGPLYSDSNELRAKKVWTKYHEIFLIAGPRWSPMATGLKGLYVSTKAGIGTAFSPVYHSWSVLLQPEVGYAFSFGVPGFYLTLGLGALLNLPFYENLDFAVPWKAKRRFNALGVIVHQIIPILNVGLGFSV